MKYRYFYAGAAALAIAAPSMAQEHNHSQMDHGAEDGETICLTAGRVPPYSEGSGTSRLPGRGLVVSTYPPGSDCNPYGWSTMVHGHVWGVYSDQSGPRGDDKAYVQSMAMLTGERSFDWGRLQLKSMLSLER
jgi:hypothetical protein